MHCKNQRPKSDPKSERDPTPLAWRLHRGIFWKLHFITFSTGAPYSKNIEEQCLLQRIEWQMSRMKAGYLSFQVTLCSVMFAVRPSPGAGSCFEVYAAVPDIPMYLPVPPIRV